MESVVRARINNDVKERAEAALDEIGRSTSDAIRLLMLYVADQGRLPFDVAIPAAHQSDSEYKKEAEKWELYAYRLKHMVTACQNAEKAAVQESVDLSEEIAQHKQKIRMLEQALIDKDKELVKLKKPAARTGSSRG